MSPIDPYLGAQAPTQDFIRTFLDREIPAGLLFYAPFLPQTGNQAWAADKRIVVPTTEVVDADGSYFAKDGLVRRTRANSLRMESLGGLIEGARTNLCIQSNDFNNAAWVKANMNIGADAIVLPDGSTGTVNTLVATATNATIIQDLGVLPNVAYCFTVYLRRKTGVGGVDVTLDNGATWTAVTIYADRWTRVGKTQVLASPDAGIRLQTNADEVYVAFAQPETGAFPTSYIPTVAAAVTRAQENIQYASANHIARDGTLFCAFTPEADSGDLPAFRYYVDTRLAAGGDGILLQNFQTPARVRFMVRSGGGWSATLSALAASVRGQTYIAACTWRTNNFRLYLDGVLQASDLAGAPPAAHNVSIYVGQQDILTDQAFANIAHLAIFNRSMSIDEVIQRSHFFRNQMARAS